MMVHDGLVRHHGHRQTGDLQPDDSKLPFISISPFPADTLVHDIKKEAEDDCPISGETIGPPAMSKAKVHSYDITAAAASNVIIVRLRGVRKWMGG